MHRALLCTYAIIYCNILLYIIISGMRLFSCRRFRNPSFSKCHCFQNTACVYSASKAISKDDRFFCLRRLQQL